MTQKLEEGAVALGPFGARDSAPRQVDTAVGLLQGSFDFYHYPRVEFEWPIDWSVNPLDNTWRWALHSFQPLYSLVNATVTAETGPVRERVLLAHSFIEDWWASHADREIEPSPYSWRGHCVGLRAQLIAWVNLPRGEWQDALVEAHAEELMREDVYELGHNHGLDQDLGLLALAGLHGREDWGRFAMTRAAKSAMVMVDEQGATAEQAVGYSFYVLRLLRQLKWNAELQNLPVPKEILRYQAIPEFLTYATQPDGRYVPIGDTSPVAAFNAEGISTWAATKGAQGAVPPRKEIIFDRGWVFGRSGWGGQTPFEEETFFSLRFGPGKSEMDHGHVDQSSVTYFSGGSPLVIDAAFGGYGDRAQHTAEKSERGHSMVLVEGAGDFIRDAPCTLLEYSASSAWSLYSVQDRPYEEVLRTRTLVYLRAEHALAIYDHVVLGAHATAVQRWLINSDAVTDDDSPASTFRATVGSTRMEIQELLGAERGDFLRGQVDPLIDGWESRAPDDRRPAEVVRFRQRGNVATFLTLLSTGNITGESSGDQAVIYAGGDVRYRMKMAAEGRIIVTTV
ncbi:heparinase II/III family protein [uncultured Brachybacterium sp.]|uniref:heparinase II/III family protein n=1 Tax=uncultured Brachybacterium sp. TaxID=189680 RepID=UPI0026151968|nr:heparinase II/III family protein [uncultured Brachybacterium sp.]